MSAENGKMMTQRLIFQSCPLIQTNSFEEHQSTEQHASNLPRARNGQNNPKNSRHGHGHGCNKSKHCVRALINEKYRTYQKIGRGTDGVVKLCKIRKSWIKRHTVDPNDVSSRSAWRAIKIIDKSRIDDSHMKDIYKEMNILQQLSEMSHANGHILRCYETIESEKRFYIVTELLSSDTLASCIYKLYSQNGKLPEIEVAKIFYQLCEGLSFLHSLNVVHRDLKPENILFKKDNQGQLILKIIDFGLAGILTDDNNYQLTERCGTPYFVSPEMVDLKVECYDSKVDMWSAGAILFTMFCGELPFGLKNNEPLDVIFKQILTANVEDRMVSHHWNEVSVSGKDLLLRLLERDPTQRLSATETLEHHWFGSIFATETNSADCTDCTNNANNAI